LDHFAVRDSYFKKRHKLIRPPKQLTIDQPLLVRGPAFLEQVQRRIDLLKQALNCLAVLQTGVLL